ncbi:MAG TPA: GatB/YqeY domain-containing protein [Mycobacteriales bacterium]|nr:GatB/YqeY domain-containing protein [Mycobacteriales bacterium]
MSALKDRLQADLTAAMKARDEVTTATLRMLLTAVGTEEVAGKAARELSDDEVLKVVAREAKKRREAATAFADGGRPDRAERELAEERVLAGYLPAQLSDEELQELVRAAVESTGASGPKDMGAVMKAVVPQVAGRADGGRVSAAVKAALQG